MVIDHVFMIIEEEGSEIDRFAEMGLVETYRRTHPGQGTQNVCYCFDNMFVELLWVNDRTAARSAPIARTGLDERSRWRDGQACPFGIAWRRSGEGAPSRIPTWDYNPPYLPTGLTIAVAIDGDDTARPMMFESPGSAPPCEWPSERRRDLQRGAGLGSVTAIELTMPAGVVAGAALEILAARSSPPFRIGSPGPYRLDLRIASLRREPDLHLVLPRPG